MTKFLSGVRMTLFVMLCLMIAIVSARYLVPGAPGAAPDILANGYTRFGALTAHVTFAIIALAIGPFQFLNRVRVKNPSLHRRLGTLYVITCICGAIAGFALALGTTAGPIASVGFGGLAVCWIGATAQAWRFARARDFTSHQRWMIRSFALTFAAVTLRLYLPISMVMGWDFMDSYRAISFLCWIPNLIVAEIWIAATMQRKAAA